MILRFVGSLKIQKSKHLRNPKKIYIIKGNDIVKK